MGKLAQPQGTWEQETLCTICFKIGVLETTLNMNYDIHTGTMLPAATIMFITVHNNDLIRCAYFPEQDLTANSVDWVLDTKLLGQKVKPLNLEVIFKVGMKFSRYLMLGTVMYSVEVS